MQMTTIMSVDMEIFTLQFQGTKSKLTDKIQFLILLLP